MSCSSAGRTGETAGTATGRTGETAGTATGRTGETAGTATGRTVTRLTDPRALRAYAHPIRMKLVGLLRTEGPLTATRAGELIGESSGSASFHLRQLAKYGLVEEAGGGTGREKPWRASSTSTDWDETAGTPELAAATGLLNTVIGLRPALWIATLGGIAGFFLLLPSPLPGYRLPAGA